MIWSLAARGELRVGREGVPRLFNAEWPAYWYSAAGRDRPTTSSQQPAADDAVAVLEAVANDKLPEALEPIPTG